MNKIKNKFKTKWKTQFGKFKKQYGNCANVFKFKNATITNSKLKQVQKVLFFFKQEWKKSGKFGHKATKLVNFFTRFHYYFFEFSFLSFFDFLKSSEDLSLFENL